MAVPYESIPNGWFAVATSRELRPGRLLERRYFGREWVLWRGTSGTAAIQEAYCPHLGAHLGGGRVCGDHLRCPFHGFEYASSGECMRSPGADRPARIRLPSLPLRESHGLVLAYWDAEGRAPDWEPPCLDAPGFSTFSFLSSEFRGHPQEICENSSDCAHFGPTHGYGNAHTTSAPRVEGRVLYVGYAMDRSLDFVGLPGTRAELAFAAEVHGLGVSRVRARIERIRLEADLLILPTPIDADHVQLRFAARVRESRIPLLTTLVKALFVRGYRHDLMTDVPIWSRKRYVPRPPLSEADAPIAVYRRYARQFYPGDGADGSDTARSAVARLQAVG